jgi:hypothetical protein
MVFTLFVGLNPSIPKAVETETCCLDKCFSQAYLESVNPFATRVPVWIHLVHTLVYQVYVKRNTGIVERAQETSSDIGVCYTVRLCRYCTS